MAKKGILFNGEPSGKVARIRTASLQPRKDRKPVKRSKPMKRAQQVEPEQRESSERQRFTVQLSAETIDKLRDAVYFTPGLTLSKLAEEALRDAVTDLEAKRGEAFPPRTGELKTGRPVKT